MSFPKKKSLKPMTPLDLKRNDRFSFFMKNARKHMTLFIYSACHLSGQHPLVVIYVMQTIYGNGIDRVTLPLFDGIIGMVIMVCIIKLMSILIPCCTIKTDYYHPRASSEFRL
jgi:hypothetical protein